MDRSLLHYGVKRRSGRYPWGSGQNPYQREAFGFLSQVDGYREQGLSDKDIAAKMGMTTTQLRGRITWANKEVKEAQRTRISEMHKEGISNSEIARQLGMSEGSVRNHLSKLDKPQVSSLDATVDALKNGVENAGYLDVGVGVERQIGVSKEKLKAARQKLLEEGYYEHEIYLRQITNMGQRTTIKVLTKEPDIEVVKLNSDKIRTLEAWSEDNGMTFQNIKPPQMVDWDRVSVRYMEDGGADKDGLIELRKGVEDLDLGSSKYAQVRIGVGGTHYLKGMAIYSDGPFPKGADIIFNTNKSKEISKKDALKQMSDNKDNPFKSTIVRQKGALNIVNEEGDWDTWSGKLSSQMLSKQPLKLVQERLKATYEKNVADFEEINSLTNPLVKKYLMQKYSDGMVTKARDLKALGISGTKNHVILPVVDMDPSQVYAPNYKNGDRVALIRHPHGGIFEIPELTVNNKGPGKNMIGNALDAIGIHPSVASKLSGADFDGDTVLVIPNNKKKIKSSRSLDGLKNFDPMKYKVGHKTITKDRTQLEMGKVSNLITDMTLKGATESEIARAVRHSMVVIDAEKHQLDYKRSAMENGISALNKKYQTHIDEITGKTSRGASTLISKSSSDIRINKREKTFTNRKGEKITKTVSDKVYRMDIVDDARKLSSGTKVENAYASYANKVKALQNKSAKIAQSIKPVKRDPQAAIKYKEEVKSLNEKLNTALLNAPRERQAQLLATKTYYKNVKPDMSKKEKQRLRSQAIAGARSKVIPGGKKTTIHITDKEWAAIQEGAISNEKLSLILNNTDMNRVKQLATPRPATKLSSAKLTRARTLLNKGKTYAEVAEALGTTTTVIRDGFAEQSKKKGVQ